MKPDIPDLFFYERELQRCGVVYPAGIDEAGRGPLAGPVLAACVILRFEKSYEGLNDSKQLSERKREYWYQRLECNSRAIGVGLSSHAVIDDINILNATRRAMVRAIQSCQREPDYLLVDAIELPLTIPQRSMIHGDCLSFSIAAASVIAKVTRDAIMKAYHLQWPHYGFDRNKGYPTREHLCALHKFGPCPIHRKTFSGVKEYLGTSMQGKLFP